MTIVYPQCVVDYMASLGKAVGNRREEHARRQFAVLQPVLDRWTQGRIPALLDIGCGLGIIDALIANYYVVDTVHLMDGDGTGPALGGYKPDTKAWNDVNMGVETVRANLMDDRVQVFGHYAGPTADISPVDLVISCRSWCHHYPAAVYAASVRRWLRPGGLVVTDIRNKTDGFDVIRRHGFEPLERVPDHSFKCERWLFHGGS